MRAPTRVLLLAVALLAGSAAAQPAPDAHPAVPNSANGKPASPASKSEPPAPKSDAATPGQERVFKPSDEVSPDQEVDFPADL